MRRRDLLLGFGCVLTVPRAARAQQKSIPTIGFLSVFSPEAAGPRLAAFRRGLAETGYVEDRNLRIEYRWGKGQHDQMPALAADLVGRGVDLIVTNAPPAARAAKRATATIPIVFVVGRDPVREGLVASLARPGGNMTGIGFLIGELEPKRLELLSELVPAVKTVAR
jgi:putative ABC transport system substrate-binding protein